MISDQNRQLLEGLLAGSPEVYAAMPFLTMTGLVLSTYTEGEAVYAWDPTEHWVMGDRESIFGGAAATALEAGYGTAMATMIDDREFQVALRLSTDYLRPAKLNTRYTVTARVTDRAGQTMFCDGDIRDPENQLIARGTAVCRIVRPQPST